MDGLTFVFELTLWMYRWTQIRPNDLIRGDVVDMILLSQTWWQFVKVGDIIQILATSYWRIVVGLAWAEAISYKESVGIMSSYPFLLPTKTWCYEKGSDRMVPDDGPGPEREVRNLNAKSIWRNKSKLH